MAGETPDADTGAAAPASTSLELPAYFENQAVKVQDIATEREKIVAKRLNNCLPQYPAAELQTTFQPKLAIGIAGELWLDAKVDIDELQTDIGMLPADITELLERGDFEAVIARGYNVVQVELLEQVDMQDLLRVVIAKHLRKYYPPEAAG